MFRAWKVYLTAALIAALATVNTVLAQEIDVDGTVGEVVNTIDNFVDKVIGGIKGVASGIVSSMQDLASFVKTAVVDLSKILAVILGVLGGLLWFSGISPYRGRRLVFSALLLALFSIIVTSI